MQVRHLSTIAFSFLVSASAETASIASKEGSHIVDIKEKKPEKKKKVKKKNIYIYIRCLYHYLSQQYQKVSQGKACPSIENIKQAMDRIHIRSVTYPALACNCMCSTHRTVESVVPKRACCVEHAFIMTNHSLFSYQIIT